MAGVTKHIYDHETRDIIQMWSNQIKSIIPILNKEYTESDIILLLKQYYPHEWKSVEIKYEYYQKKDKHIIKHYGKARYSMPKPEVLLKSLSIYNQILSPDFKRKWKEKYSIEQQEAAQQSLWNKRKTKSSELIIKSIRLWKKLSKLPLSFSTN